MSKENNVVDMNNIKNIKLIQDSTPELQLSDKCINKALNEAKERSVMYDAYDNIREKELQEKQGINLKQCYNEACPYCNSDCECNSSMVRPVGCLYRMTEWPPNSLNYDGYMPNHKESLDMLEKHGLLKGNRQQYLEANSTYDRCTSRDERQNTEIKGITMRQAEKAIIGCIEWYFNFICKDDGLPEDYFDKYIDITAIAQNCCVEFEKAMHIYPNIKMR